MGNLDLVKKLREESGAGVLACQKALKEANNDYDKAYDILRKQGASKALSKADRVATDGLCCCALSDDGKKIAIVKLHCETDFVAKNGKFQQLATKITESALKNKCQNVEDLLNSAVDNGTSVKDLIVNVIASVGENIVIGDVKVYNLKDGQKVTYYIHNKAEGSENLGRIVSVIISDGCDNEDSNLLLKQLNMHIAAMSPIALSEDRISDDIVAREKAIYEDQVSKLNKPADIANKMVEGKLRKFYEESVLMKQIFVFDNKTRIEDVLSSFNKNNNTKLTLVDFVRFSI